VTLSPRRPEIGFIHRKLPGGDLYFVANTANEARQVRAQFRNAARHAEAWDAFTGKITGLPDPKNIDLDLAPYESRLIYFSDDATAATPQPKRRESVIANLSRQWKVSFGESGLSVDMDQLASWSDNARTQFFSGLATYQKEFNLPSGKPQGTTVVLDFGPGTRVPVPSPAPRPNMRAYLEGPIREAGQVYVNGQFAGAVWRPPYRLDVTHFVHDGTNELRVVVGNTAINALAGSALPDYRLLWDRYGMLFVPQGMEDLHPLPSGMLGPVTLLESIPSK